MHKKVISLLLSILILTIFSGTAHASASAKVFANSQSAYYHDCAVYAQQGYRNLGYSCSSTMGAITKASMLSWIRSTGNEYGMYVHTLGGSGYFNDYYGSSISSSECSGYWDFVYIDSSYSGRTTALADAFHTTGYTNRCFLGWRINVTTSNSKLFNYYFWLTYVGRSSVHAAAINAAACVPGANAAPSKLYGSTTYTGVAR